MLRFRCPACDATVAAPERAAGREARCPACRERVLLPGLAAPPPRRRPAGCLLLLVGSAGLCACVGLAWWLAGPPLAAPFPPSEEELLVGEVAAHPFWRVKVTGADVAKLVAAVRAGQEDSLVWVDDHFRLIVTDDDEQSRFHRRRHLPTWRAAFTPRELTPRHVVFVTADYHSRPSRLRVLRDLKDKLDAADFHGPR